MNRIRAALPWRKKSYYGDSDSTGYCSSSDVSKALSDSQFILRPNTALMSSSYSNSSNYYALDYSENPRGQSQSQIQNRNQKDKQKQKDKDKGTVTSRTSTISSTTFKSHSLTTDGDDEGDSTSTIRANSVRQVPMMPQLTSIQHLMLNLQEKQEKEEEDDVATLDEVSSDDDDVTLDIVPRHEYRNSSFRSFPFSYQLMETEMDRLFDMMHVDDAQRPSTSSCGSLIGKNRQKRLWIREKPTSKIYYHDEYQEEGEIDQKLPPKPSITRTESVPRSILKKKNCAIYEEIYGDHLTPPPIDIRPELPERKILTFQQFPPCTTFQPRILQRLPSVRRRKKMPSLHHSTSFASYFRRKK